MIARHGAENVARALQTILELIVRLDIVNPFAKVRMPQFERPNQFQFTG